MPVLVLLAALLVSPAALSADTMYANDPARELKEDIEDAYGLYILNPSRRHSKEKVEINGETVELWLYHDPRKPDFDQFKCDAIRWLLLGRFGKGGAQPFFAQFQKFNAVELDIFELQSSRTVDRDGKYDVRKTPNTIMKLRLSRRRAERLKWDQVRATLDKLSKPSVEPEQCVRTAERLVDAKWYNTREYFR